ncbi:c-type cytochrome biogenesis protein CcmI [Mangrovimicrobium sediminis]|uniref:C-type cytochrome biogenesis protein CcmI n=1 Tax=Mangrovimicrobium sediminis TaxID=2562682 RepID=A0A4Z0M6R0_9GAMM|nr:c-type cytochrome biogenesis protein CcmI [Haliea sp. SAOS-164]TGD75199.1 c-type cytochrome biogenesis protein CcmI [Haliea sp. SAOS-164]
MTVFYLACAALVALAAVFLLVPLAGRERPVDDDPEAANLAWYRLRREELAGEGDDALAEDAKLRLLEDTAGATPAATQAAPPPAARRFLAWLLLPVLLVFAVVVYYRLGAAPDVVIARQLQDLHSDMPPQELQALADAITARAAQRPDNLDYTVMLGQFAMQRQDYAAAARYYDTLAAAAPGDAGALAYAAQAHYLAAGRSLTDETRRRAQQALAINPHQRTALGLLGMASFEAGEYRDAMGYWERLLAVEPPGSDSYRMISGVIDTARERLGMPPREQAMAAAAGGPGATGPAPAAGPSAGVTVSVTAPADATLDPAATVFILARDGAGTSRMPIAVQRLRAADLPVTIRLDDSNSMAGQKISGFASVLVQVQVSPDGRPGAENASWLGQAGPLAPDLSEQPVSITLAPNAGS